MRQFTFVGSRILEWRDAPEPAIEAGSQAIVRPIAVALCDLDRAVISGRVPYPGPFAFGHECTAEVVSVGDEVTTARPGDVVSVAFQISCGTCDRCSRGLTGSCETVRPYSMYGLPVGGDWGGMLSDRLRVPFADAMLVKLPPGVDPVAVASLSDNIPDGWRTVGPGLEARPGADVLIVAGGAGSIALYAAAIAVTMGAGRVDYIDTNADRLRLAKEFGANVIEGMPERRPGKYAITVDASADPAGLSYAIKCTEPGGTCTSVGIYYDPETPVPLFHMYNIGLTLTTGRVHARPAIPKILDLVASGAFHPELVTTAVVDATEAIDAVADPPTKLIIRM